MLQRERLLESVQVDDQSHGRQEDGKGEHDAVDPVVGLMALVLRGPSVSPVTGSLALQLESAVGGGAVELVEGGDGSTGGALGGWHGAGDAVLRRVEPLAVHLGTASAITGSVEDRHWDGL